jgi:hypothetical protein
VKAIGTKIVRLPKAFTVGATEPSLGKEYITAVTEKLILVDALMGTAGKIAQN